MHSFQTLLTGPATICLNQIQAADPTGAIHFRALRWAPYT
jgi:hypothetical protein